ncbi:hypothetical protein HOP50_05g37080 [Chloropicon primus]|nr:hypothetical protein HOP50_05g37080 [Chloropicon primus]
MARVQACSERDNRERRRRFTPRGSERTKCKAIALPSQATELLQRLRTFVPDLSVPQASFWTGQYSARAQYGVVAVVAVAVSVLLLKIFRKGKGEAKSKPPAQGGQVKEAESVGGPSESKELGGGPVSLVNGLLFGNFSSLSWLLILVTLLFASSFPRNLLEDILMT